MAPGMFLGFHDLASKLGLNPISGEDMEKIMWRNTARLWKLNPQTAARKVA
jgi:predicted TIM-barrel fold metal-dependent hydrolase